MTNATAKRNIFIELVSFQGCLSALLSKANGAQAVRDYETVRSVGSLLIESSLPACATAGQYFAGVALIGEDTAKAQKLLEQAAASVGHFADRAKLSLGSVAIYQGNYSAVRQFSDSLKRAANARIVAGRELNQAIAEDSERQHNVAAARLERLAVVAPPQISGHALNNLALAYLNQGQIEAALAAVRLALLNPYSRFNPTWLETYARIARERQAHERCYLTVPVVIPEIVEPDAASGYRRIENFLATKPSAKVIHAFADGGEERIKGLSL